MLGIFEEQTCFLTGHVFHIKNFQFGCLDCISPNVLLVCSLSFFLFFLKFALYICNNLTYCSFTIYFEMYLLPLFIPSKMLAAFTSVIISSPMLQRKYHHDLYFWCLFLQKATWKFQLANRLMRLWGCLWTHRLLQWNSSVIGLKQRVALSTYQGAVLSMSVLVVFLFSALSFHSCCWHPPASWGISLPTAFGLHWKWKTTPTFSGCILLLGKN